MGGRSGSVGERSGSVGGVHHYAVFTKCIIFSARVQTPAVS